MTKAPEIQQLYSHTIYFLLTDNQQSRFRNYSDCTTIFCSAATDCAPLIVLRPGQSTL